VPKRKFGAVTTHTPIASNSPLQPVVANTSQAQQQPSAQTVSAMVNNNDVNNSGQITPILTRKHVPSWDDVGVCGAFRRVDNFVLSVKQDGFIIQHIEREFTVEIREKNGTYTQLNNAKLLKDRLDPKNHFDIADYWELFTYDRKGIMDGDQFASTWIAPVHKGQPVRTTRGTYKMTGTAWFFPLRPKESVTVQSLGFRSKKVVPLANELYCCLTNPMSKAFYESGARPRSPALVVEMVAKWDDIDPPDKEQSETALTYKIK
jgi:hypothetical protein